MSRLDPMRPAPLPADEQHTIGVLEDLRRTAAEDLERHWQLPTCSRCRHHVPWQRLSRQGAGSSVCLDCMAAAQAVRRYWRQIGAAS